MFQKLLRVTFEVSFLFLIGTLLPVIVELYLSDLATQILFTAAYLFLAVLLFFTLQNTEPNKGLSYTLIHLMWAGVLQIPAYQLLYSSAAGDISIADVTSLTVIGLFVFAYCTIFKNSQSGFVSLFVDNTFNRYWVAVLGIKKFFLLIYITALIAGWILLSSYLINWVFLMGVQ